MRYRLTLVDTALTVGRAACLPLDGIGLPRAAAHLERAPMDSAMHAFVLGHAMDLDAAGRAAMARDFAGRPVVLSAVAEAAVLAGQEPLRACGDPDALREHTPSVILGWAGLPDRGLHARWIERLGANVLGHALLEPLERMGLDAPVSDQALAEARQEAVTVRQVRPTLPRGPGAGQADPAPDPPPDEVARAALDALRKGGHALGAEQRHQDSLSPVALVRPWDFEIRVRNGALDYALGGSQASFGRGLWLDRARAACLMEVAERRSAWADVGPGGIQGLAGDGTLIRATCEDLAAQGPADMAARGLAVLDPSALALEVPYQGRALWWMPGTRPDKKGGETIVWLPAQLAVLFANLDEADLFSGLGSTGLGAGASMAGARRAALLECIERDAEAVTPFDASRCFRPAARDRQAARLLAEYQAQGVHVVCMDMTPAWGVPCYKAFVVRTDGSLARGASAHLDGARAVLSALTEVPHPYPGGPPTRTWDEIFPRGLPVRRLEDLPDLSTGTAAGDAALLERTLAANGHAPVYADLTRADLGIPVVRAVVPGLEAVADFDRFSRVCPRLWANYLALFA